MRTVAFVFDGLGYGGIERIGTDYVQMLFDLGYDVDVYNLNPAASAFVNNLPEGVHYRQYKFSRKSCPETYSYGIQKWWWGKYAYAIISPVLSVVQLIKKMARKREEYDVAIAISGHINDLSFVAKNFIKGKKKICWCHGNLISYLAICDAYSILYKKIDTIVTLSSAGEKDVYAGKKFLYDKQIVKLYNPTYIATKAIDEEKVRCLRKQYGNYLLMIARFEPGKGQDTAIRVVKKLKDDGLDLKLLFAGDGDKKKEIQNLSKELSVQDNCVFLGNVSDIQNYIMGSYVNILTSRWEGLPTVIIEAMALGKPCVMTNTDDGEVSHGGEYCFLNEIDDLDGIAKSICRLYKDSALYEKYVSLSLERSKAFDPKIIRNRLISLIES